MSFWKFFSGAERPEKAAPEIFPDQPANKAWEALREEAGGPRTADQVPLENSRESLTGGDWSAAPAESSPIAEQPDQPEPHFLHKLNKGGLDDILLNQRLKVNDGNRDNAGGAEAVNAYRGEIEATRKGALELPEHIRQWRAEEVVIAFTTDVPPTSEHPKSHWTRWSVPLPLEQPQPGSMESGGYLPIKVLGVYDGLGNPLPPEKLGRRDISPPDERADSATQEKVVSAKKIEE